MTADRSEPPAPASAARGARDVPEAPVAAAEAAFLGRFARIRSVRSLAGAALLLAVAVASGFLLGPRRPLPDLPGDDALGSPAPSTIKADRDYDVLDPDTTEEKREQAARSVWPIYTSDGASQEMLSQRIRLAFALGQGAVFEWREAHQGRAGRPGTEPAKARLRKVPPDLLRVLAGRRDAFVKALQAVVDDEQYLELAAVGFDPAVESAALRLSALVSSGYTVAQRELLAADRERGITVRTLVGDESVGEKQVRDLGAIRDLAQVRAETDRLAQDQLPELPPPLRRAVAQLVRRSLRPNLVYDDLETRRRIDEKRAAVKDVLVQVKKGDTVVGEGEPVTKSTLLVFHAMAAAGRNPGAGQVRWGGGLLAALLCLAALVFARRNVPRFSPRGRDVLLLATVLVGQLLLARGCLAGAELLHDLARDRFGPRSVLAAAAGDLFEAAVPWAAGAMLVRLLLTGASALAWCVAFAPLCGLLAGGALQPALLALVGGLVAADHTANAGRKAALFRAGLWTAGANVLVVAASALFSARFWSTESLAALAGAAVGGALLVPLTVLAVAPLFELAFGVTTDIQLLKLANFNHPLLKDLIVQAPGTYHHSIVIGALVEEAARAIGGNPLLSRVGAYYHDIGKGKNPLFFGENQRGDNRHDQLTPAMSAALIRRHVSEGLELARQARLPKPVREFIAQHHGTRLIGYFYARAREEAERAGSPPPPEAEFRYLGPRPQTREVALVMIAEVVVASSRNLSEASPQSLRALVDHAVASALADGQLEECELTQRDLRLMAESFVATLSKLYRGRPGGSASLPPDAARPMPPLRVLGAPEAPPGPALRAGKP